METKQVKTTKVNNNDNWVFVPVKKSRIIKTLKDAVLIKIDNETSTILPLVFKRKKETETDIFFSLPKDFKMNIRKSVYNKETKTYDVTDDLWGILNKKGDYAGKPIYYVHILNKELDIPDDALPF